MRAGVKCTWREACKAADYALEHFGDPKRDRGIWVWYCQRIGLDTFLKLPPNLRRFAVALKRTMVDFRGPECDIRKKVCSACKISTATYYLHLSKLEKLLP